MTRIEPGMPHAVIRTSKDLYVRDGELVLGWDLTTTPEIIEQFRQGYRCVKCYAVQSVAFPEVCEEVYKDGGGCGYPMRAEQMWFLEREYRGEEPLWPNRQSEE